MKFSEDVEQILDTHAASGPGSVRPTRRQIIEEAVRMWASQSRLCCNECGDTEGHRPGCIIGVLRGKDMHHRAALELSKLSPELLNDSFAALLRGDGYDG